MCIKIGDYPGGHTTVPNETLQVILETSKSFSLFPLNDLRVCCNQLRIQFEETCLGKYAETLRSTFCIANLTKSHKMVIHSVNQFKIYGSFSDKSSKP